MANLIVVIFDQTKCLDSCKADDGWKMSITSTGCTDSSDNMNICISNLYIYIYIYINRGCLPNNIYYEGKDGSRG